MPIRLVRRNDSQGDLFEIPPINGSDILVVPTKRRIRYVTRELLAEKKTASEQPVFTLELLARRLFDTAFSHQRLIEDPVQSILFGQAIELSKQQLKYFDVRGRYETLPRGTLDKVIHVIRYLKEFGVYPETLSEELGSEEEDEQAKLRDIYTIYSAYESLLESVHGVDIEGLFKSLHLVCSREKFEETFRIVFPEARSVSIVGFDEFTEAELGVIQRIASMNIEVSLDFDYLRGNEALFGHLSQNYKKFLAMGFVEGEGEANSNLVAGYGSNNLASSTCRHIAENLFNRSAKIMSRKDSRQLTIVKAKDRVAEVQVICKLIKQIVAENPRIPLSRICVAMYRPQVYTAIMREQFRNYGISANITDRFELSQSSVVSAIIGLLEVAVRGFRREDLLRSVGSTYFAFEKNGSSIDAANLMHVARILRIVAGPRSWTAKIDKHIQKLRQDVLMPGDEEENARREREVGNMERAKRDIRLLESVLADIYRDQNPLQFQMHLHNLLRLLKVFERVLSVGINEHADVVEKDARALSKFLEVIDNVVNLLVYQEGKDQRHSLRFFVEQLKIAISQERYNVREQFGQGILVTSINETRGLPVDIMIVAGLVDGEFPSVYQSELFFGDKRMKEREQRHTWETRYLFYQAVTNWSDRLVLTYPEQEAELDLVRSSFVDALLKVVDAEQWTYPGNTSLEQTLHSEDELLRHQGSLMLAGASVNPIDAPVSFQPKIDYISQSLRIESSRIEHHTLPEFEGYIFNTLSEEAQANLRKLKHRVYSVSQLETYGKCPFQFFAQRLLRLNAIEDVEETFSPLDKGSVLHEILFAFYTKRRDDNLPQLIGCSEKEFSDAHQQLMHIAEAKLAEIDIPDAFWDLEKELILGDKHTGRGLLHEFLEFERKRSTSMRPALFEVGFGASLGAQSRIDKSFYSEDPVVAGEVHLRGKVDRVEIGEDGFAIIDYKTGKELPKLNDIREGISLQLPIYLYTIEKLLLEKEGKALQPAGGVYYQLRSPVDLKVGIGSDVYKSDFGVVRSNQNLVPTNDDLRQLIDESITMVNKYVDEITQGKFPLTQQDKVDKVCTYCDYKTVCRIQAVRRVKKPIEEE